ncbi:MAG TPA: hypothetical protein VN874_06070 [Myxococcales bacterium]|nr:hypothetical protein [Myxococcales bacterium]
MAKARNRSAPPGSALAQAEEALARGDTRRGRAILRQALATASAVDRDAAEVLLRRTRVDPVALGVAGAVLLVILLAAWFALLHRAA